MSLSNSYINSKFGTFNSLYSSRASISSLPYIPSLMSIYNPIHYPISHLYMQINLEKIITYIENRKKYMRKYNHDRYIPWSRTSKRQQKLNETLKQVASISGSSRFITGSLEKILE